MPHSIKLSSTIALIGCLLTACGRPGAQAMQKEVAGLHEIFPALEALRVQVFRDQDWCKNIRYARGIFSDSSEITCNVLGGQPKPFDDQARIDFRTIEIAVRKTRVNVGMISNARYDELGKLTHAEFHIFGLGGHRYVYEPGYRPLPADMPHEREYQAISKDWYYLWVDWN